MAAKPLYVYPVGQQFTCSIGERMFRLIAAETYEGRPCKHGHGATRTTRDRRCVECRRQQKRRWRAKNPESGRRSAHKFRIAHPERATEYAWRRNRFPAPTRASTGICECCGRRENRRTLSLDHNHLTGEFRGWLCNRCNCGIGLLDDTLGGLLRAVAYLQANDSTSWLE